MRFQKIGFPRIKIYGTGKATLSGLNYDDLRSILTAARLYRYDHPFVPEAIVDDCPYPDLVARNNQSGKAWDKRQAALLDTASDSLQVAIQATFPYNDQSKTIAERWAAVRGRIRIRKFIGELWERRRGQIANEQPA